MNLDLDGVSAGQPATRALRTKSAPPTEAAQAPEPEAVHSEQMNHDHSARARHGRIAIAAYYLAEARGFAPGHDADDWARAQAQVDASDAALFENY